MRRLTIGEVAAMFGKQAPEVGKRSHCLIRRHKRSDKVFSVFRSKEGTVLWKCHSCDAPDDRGDALKLYCVLSQKDRKTAWRELKDYGYEVPGLQDAPQGNRPMPRPKLVPIQGRDADAKEILSLAPERWSELQSKRLGAVEAFALTRGLDAEFLRQHDVVDMASDVIGFGYRDPKTNLPCRVKARALERKSYWIEPRGEQGKQGIALSPLYLANDIQFLSEHAPFVVVTEGEVDALTLRAIGIPSAVSLPDGSGSASKVDLSPLWYRSAVVLSATDADEEGERAHRDLFARVHAMGKQIARLRWTDGNGRTFKDANEALLAGFGREQFVSVMERSLTQLQGYEVRLADAS